MSTSPEFSPFEARMQAEGLPQLAIDTFAHYYGLLRSGQTGLIAEAEISAVDALPDAEALDPSLAEVGRAALAQTVVIKLNGGLGTSMGLAGPKSLLVVKEGQSFLDITAQQCIHNGAALMLMNSFSTREDSLAALEAWPQLPGALPRDFCQHKVPKVLADGFGPADWPENPELAWCPPGHGDLYTALVTSGALEVLLAAGVRFAFVSNIDNLGATVAPELLGHMIQQGLPFMMEVTDRTPADRKGGHLARAADGRLILREIAQCPEADLPAFQDIDRHRFFNTNNIWLDLAALKERLDATGAVLGLPMIRNAKTLDPRDPDSPQVYQLETAMGAAIAVFEGAGAVRVPRRRFIPVKTTGDLVAIRSDLYVVAEDHTIVPNPARRSPAPLIDLDPKVYKRIDDMEARFPHGSPVLLDCALLTVRGDVHFGAHITVQGEALIEGPGSVPDGAILTGHVALG